jgi:hypothetical protein
LNGSYSKSEENLNETSDFDPIKMSQRVKEEHSNYRNTREVNKNA